MVKIHSYGTIVNIRERIEIEDRNSVLVGKEVTSVKGVTDGLRWGLRRMQ